MAQSSEAKVGIETFDVLIIGAGLSGIDAAWHLQKESPQRRYVVLEGRQRIGGTWDLFRYPGVRSDSDMFTMGYGFRPWTENTAISPGERIREYICETARESGIDRHIRFSHRVIAMHWCSETQLWTLDVLRSNADGTDEKLQFRAQFVISAAGYYRYASGYTPDFPGVETYRGQIIHPQHWPEGLEYTGKTVVVIGSGATAVTLVPSMAKEAGHVFMLQRSPTYYINRPARDGMFAFFRSFLPTRWAFGLARWRNICFQRFLFTYARRNPEKLKRRLLASVRRRLGDDYDVETHFTPKYNPWEERLCLVPDGDFFSAIRSGKAEVVTDRIRTFTPEGIALESGRTLTADIIVTATGLELELLGGVTVEVDGMKVDISESMTYKGVMFSEVPNLINVFGYVSASWTLRADLVCEYAARLINLMHRSNYSSVKAPKPGSDVASRPWLDFKSGYIQRAIHKLPKHGYRAPWRQNQNYFADLRDLRRAAIEDGTLVFTKRPE